MTDNKGLLESVLIWLALLTLGIGFWIGRSTAPKPQQITQRAPSVYSLSHVGNGSVAVLNQTDGTFTIYRKEGDKMVADASYTGFPQEIAETFKEFDELYGKKHNSPKKP